MYRLNKTGDNTLACLTLLITQRGADRVVPMSQHCLRCKPEHPISGWYTYTSQADFSESFSCLTLTIKCGIQAKEASIEVLGLGLDTYIS